MRNRLIVGAAVLSVWLVPLFAHAVPSIDKSYSNARMQYLRLAETDPQVSDLARWDKAASDLLIFSREFPNTDYTAKAFFLLGRLHEQTYRVRSLQSGLSQALYYYAKLAKEYPNHPLADDVLLQSGDLMRESGPAHEFEAKRMYLSILEYYPQGDMAAKAKKRLGIAPSDGYAEAARMLAAESQTTTNDSEKPKSDDSGGFLGLFSSKSSVGRDGLEIVAQDSNRSRPMVVIDPGHGGEEDGAIGVDGVKEKDVVLEIALMLEELLRDRLRADTILTRRNDADISLEERTALANSNNADLFVSIHANASVYKTAKGIETYYLDNTNDRSSLKLAERENASLKKLGSDDLSFILSDLIQNAKLDESITLAHYVQSSLHATLARYYKGVKDLGVKKAPFYVLVGAHMPCVLTEVSFIDHPVEGRRLASKRYQKLVAAALYEGVRAYFENLPH